MTDEQLNKMTVLENANELLASIRTVDDARHLMARAEAARAYAKEIKMGLDVQNTAAEIKLRAQRKAGQVLDEMKKRGELYDRTDNLPNLRGATSGTYQLKDLGITPDDSTRWQYFYRLPTHVFEEGISQFWGNERELTTRGLYYWGKSYGKPPQDTTPKPMTNARAFEQIKQAVEVIRENIRFIKASTNNGGGAEAKYYLGWVIQTMTEIVTSLIKEGFDYDPGN